MGLFQRHAKNTNFRGPKRRHTYSYLPTGKPATVITPVFKRNAESHPEILVQVMVVVGKHSTFSLIAV